MHLLSQFTFLHSIAHFPSHGPIGCRRSWMLESIWIGCADMKDLCCEQYSEDAPRQLFRVFIGN